jgi:hypothetical protein
VLKANLLALIAMPFIVGGMLLLLSVLWLCDQVGLVDEK